MDWKIKLAGQKVLGLLPGLSGLRLHHAIQSRFGMIGDMSREMREEFLGRSIFNAHFLQRHAQFDFKGCKILEIGTGWHLSDALVFYVLGASEVHTCDILPHLSEPLVFSMLESIQESREAISRQLHVEPAYLDARIKQIENATSLDELLERSNIHYSAPLQFHKWRSPPIDMDICYSHSVLQRVPIKELAQYLSLAKRCLSDSGYSYHIIHHNDHNFRHDSKIGELHYLRFEDFWYDLLQSKKFNFQNRMRHSEFLRFFENQGFVNIATETDSVDLARAGELKLANRFKSLSEEDLLITRTHLLSRVKQDMK